jgi:hypothetical protein
VLLAAAASGPQQAETTFEKDVRPFVSKYCLPCHSGRTAQAGLDLAKYQTSSSAKRDKAVWLKAGSAVASHRMPPESAPRPTQAERAKIAAWLGATFPGECDLKDPGRVTIRRLNRAEYDNTIRDLIGIMFEASADFPSDDVGYGFDNIGDVLSVSTLLAEKYLNAAESVAQIAIVLPGERVDRFEAEKLEATVGARLMENGDWGMFSGSSVFAQYDVRVSGEYIVIASAYAQQAGPEVARMALRVDGKTLRTVDVAAAVEKPARFEFPVSLRQGRHRIEFGFVNDFYNPNDPNPRNRDRNLFLEHIQVDSASGLLPELPESHRRIVFKELKADADVREVVVKFATRAYRRPVEPSEVDRLMKLVDLARKEGLPYEAGVRLVVTAVLASPNFLFRAELDESSGASRGGRAVTAWELASRLSYFLWSSTPDDQLLNLAASGELLRPQVLSAQVDRMLKDPRAKSLSMDFGVQWLQLRKLEITSRDPNLFPTYNASLRDAMIRETVHLFDYVVNEDRPVTEFLTANYTFLNGALASHYSIDGVVGEEFRRVELKGNQRAGILTHASVLTLTSNPTRTSPVKRGKWILENILGAPTPPPPPGVDALEEAKAQVAGRTMRQRLEAHRKNPECAVCHAGMDSLGLALENYDAVGAWRSADEHATIDASGTLGDGTKFSGPVQLRAILASRRKEFVRCLAQKLLTFALGRGLNDNDECNVDEIMKQSAATGYRFSKLIDAIVRSDAFLRRGDQAPQGVQE